MDILKKREKNANNKRETKLPFSVFICPKANSEKIEDYRQVFTDIVSNRIQEKYKWIIKEKIMKFMQKIIGWDSYFISTVVC